MPKILTAVFAGILIVSIVGAQTATKPADLTVSAETLDARVSSGRLISLSSAGAVMKTETGTKKIPLADLSEMTFAAAGDPTSGPGRAVVATSAGGYVTAASLTVSGGKVVFTNSSLGKISLPFSKVAAIYLPATGRSAAQVAAKCRETDIERGDQDVVVVSRKTGGWLGVQGVLKSIDAAALTFSWKETDRKISLPTVRAVFLAPSGKPEADKHSGVLTLRDGSSVRFASLAFAAGAFEVGIGERGAHSVPIAAVSSIKFVSDRVVNLSDLQPVDVKQHGLLDTTMPWRINRSVSGSPLTMAGRTYGLGVGVHSFCQLTYSLDGQYRALVAVIGIDDVVRPGGDAELTFLGDGKPLLAPLRITGKGKPMSVRIPLSGVKSFVIRVGYGKDQLDVSDHVDFGGARLIK